MQLCAESRTLSECELQMLRVTTLICTCLPVSIGRHYLNTVGRPRRDRKQILIHIHLSLSLPLTLSRSLFLFILSSHAVCRSHPHRCRVVCIVLPLDTELFCALQSCRVSLTLPAPVGRLGQFGILFFKESGNYRKGKVD